VASPKVCGATQSGAGASPAVSVPAVAAGSRQGSSTAKSARPRVPRRSSRLDPACEVAAEVASPEVRGATQSGAEASPAVSVPAVTAGSRRGSNTAKSARPLGSASAALFPSFEGVREWKTAKCWTASAWVDGVHTRVGETFGSKAEAEKAHAAALRALLSPKPLALAPRRPGCSFRFKGVSFRVLKHAPAGGVWRADINVDGRKRYLGSYDDEVAAGRAYDAAVRTIFTGERKPPRWTGWNLPDVVDVTALRRARRGRARVKNLKSSSDHAGVYWCKERKRWRAYVKTKARKTVPLGSFHDELDAARAYNEAVLGRGLQRKLNVLDARGLTPADGSRVS